jgi:hypothetical protein
MTIPGHFLLGEVFTPGTFYLEDDDPWALLTWRDVYPWHFSLADDNDPLGTFYHENDDPLANFTRRMMCHGAQDL